MTAATILTLSNGKGLDLTNPKPDDIDFDVVAEHLAKENRYNGATRGFCYSVGQHSIIGADAAFIDTGSRELAGYFLIHDGPEFALKDDTTPKKKAIAEIAAAEFGILSAEILGTFALITDRMDAAIHEAAGLAWPPSSMLRSAIKAYDEIMFVTEWRDLMRGTPHPNWDQYRKIAPLPDVIIPMHWTNAKTMFLDRCRRYLPRFDRSAAALSLVTDDDRSNHSAHLELNGGTA